jgi:hypothetical protein
MYVKGINPRISRQWPNADDPENVGQLLADQTNLGTNPVVAAWLSQVAMLRPFYKTAAGKVMQGQAVAATIPSGANRGQLAYKYPSAQQPATGFAWTYTLAPADVRAADAADKAAGAAAIESDRRWSIIQALPADVGGAIQRAATGVLKGAADTAKDTGASILGIPAWAVPVTLAAAGLFALKTLAPGLWPFGGRR